MKQILLILLLICFVLFGFNQSSWAKKQAEDEAVEEDIIEDVLPDEEYEDEGVGDEEILDEEAPLEEELGEEIPPEEEELPPEEVTEEEVIEEELPPELPEPIRPRLIPPVPRPPQAREAGARAEGEETRDIVIDSFVSLNYVFSNSPDSFILKYHIHFEGKTAARIAAVKGDAKITTEVEGFLAKWPTGECKLSVSIPDTPIGMTFRKSTDERASLNIRFNKPIVETWESACTFTDAPDAKFDTKGNPEKWLAEALKKTSPPLTRMIVPLSSAEPTTMKFTIGKQTLKDPPLGTAEIEGTGVITVTPGP